MIGLLGHERSTGVAFFYICCCCRRNIASPSAMFGQIFTFLPPLKKDRRILSRTGKNNVSDRWHKRCWNECLSAMSTDFKKKI